MLDINNLNFDITIDECFKELKPHPKFNQCRFDNYNNDINYPSQLYIKNLLRNITEDSKNTEKKSIFNIFNKNKGKKKHRNLYIDGTYGVGKTHLISATFNDFQGTKAFLSFVELTYFINFYGLENTIEKFKAIDLLLIDEFDLDDPATTRMVARLIDAINNDTLIITTSNKLPKELGGGNFDTTMFARELGIISDTFETIVVEGVSFRINLAKWQANFSNSTFDNTLTQWKNDKNIILTTFEDLMNVLRNNHPFKFFVIPKDFEGIFISNFNQFSQLDDALRFTSFIDHCYYYDTKIFIKSDEYSSIFTKEIMETPFERRFLRCNSRLDEMAVFFKY